MGPRPLLVVIIAGHLAGLAAAVGGAWAVAVVTVVGVHMAYLWAALYPHSRGFGPVLRRLPAGSAGVWLTIDDGPSEDTLALLDLLDRHGARASFFLVAHRAQARPELVREIVRRGHGLGNHTLSHPIGGFWLPAPRTTAHEIGAAQRCLEQLAGVAPRWFRSPVGICNPWVEPALAAAGLRRVSWSVRGYDAMDRDSARVFARIVSGLRPGAIVLLHEGLAPGVAVENLQRILHELQRRQLRTLLPSTATPPAPVPAVAAPPAEPGRSTARTSAPRDAGRRRPPSASAPRGPG